MIVAVSTHKRTRADLLAVLNFQTIPKEAGSERVSVSLSIHKDDALEFYAFLQRCMTVRDDLSVN